MTERLGFQVRTDYQRVPRELVEEFAAAQLPTPNIADVLGRFRTVADGITPVGDPTVPLVGPALTVRTRPSDNLMVHKAIDIAEPGDVIAIAGDGEVAHALLGELMCMHARRRGVAGFVVDGPVRDGAAISELGFPVYAKGLTPRGPFKDGPGEIGVPISCGGAVINPGDLLVGDGDGVVVVPADAAAGVLTDAKAVLAKEEEAMRQIEAGNWDRTWVDETLQNRGCD
ncbi:MAG: RraA family protein [Streptosporangiales bacterium]|nr:RraA family protein [Streptosporangiales bacterium]